MESDGPKHIPPFFEVWLSSKRNMKSFHLEQMLEKTLKHATEKPGPILYIVNFKLVT